MDIEEMKVQRDALDEQIKIVQAEARRKELELARAAETAMREAHCAQMFDVIGSFAGLSEAQHSVVYAMAYEQGSMPPAGYDQIEEIYGELAELARKILSLS